MERQWLNSTLLRSGEWPGLQVFRWPEGLSPCGQYPVVRSGGKMLRTFKNAFKRMWEEIEGQDLVEYALLIIMVSLLSVAAMKNLASGISNAYGKAATQLNSVTGGGGNGNNGNGNGNNGNGNGNN